MRKKHWEAKLRRRSNIHSKGSAAVEGDGMYMYRGGTDTLISELDNLQKQGEQDRTNSQKESPVVLCTLANGFLRGQQ